MERDQSNHALTRSGDVSPDQATPTPFKRPAESPLTRARQLLATLHERVTDDLPQQIEGRRRADRLIPASTLIDTPRPEEIEKAAS